MISSNALASTIGAEAAVLNFDDKKVEVSTDLLMEGVHFEWVEMPLKNVGCKAIWKPLLF